MNEEIEQLKLLSLGVDVPLSCIKYIGETDGLCEEVGESERTNEGTNKEINS